MRYSNRESKLYKILEREEQKMSNEWSYNQQGIKKQKFRKMEIRKIIIVKTIPFAIGMGQNRVEKANISN